MTLIGVTIGTSAAKQFVVERLRGTLSEGAADDVLTAALLVGPTGGRVHSLPFPPDNFPYPAIGFARYGGVDEAGPIGRNNPTVMTTVRLQVKAICEGFDESPIEEAGAIISQLLDGRAATVDVVKAGGGTYGTYFVECTRESELLLDLLPENDTPYQHIGGIFKFTVSRVG